VPLGDRMAEREFLGERRHAQEEEYFRNQDAQLVAKMRQRIAWAAERQQMAESTGIADQEILQDLQERGYTLETVTLLHLLPFVEVAWADRSVSPSERDLILEAARLRGITPDSPAYQKLTEWLTDRPSDELFDHSLRAVRAMLEALPPEQRATSRDDLVAYSTSIASASGGILGLGNRVSTEERAMLGRIAAELDRV
jgi:DNA-binding phage protein